jgi:hypothetical protein
MRKKENIQSDLNAHTAFSDPIRIICELLFDIREQLELLNKHIDAPTVRGAQLANYISMENKQDET